MIRKTWRKIMRQRLHKARTATRAGHPPAASSAGSPADTLHISRDIHENLESIRKIFRNESDINIREFLAGDCSTRAFIVSIEGLSDKKTIQNQILTKLMYELGKIPLEFRLNIQNIKDFALSADDVEILDDLELAVSSLFEGNTILFVDGEDTVLRISTKAWEHRGVSTPQTENVIRGSHEAFSETLRVNTALLRRRIKNPALRIETLKLGVQTKTEIAIVYIAGIAEEKIVEEVRRRLHAIKIDSILESGYIEDLICDSPYSVFPTIGNTELPDKFAGKILEGRVGILVDGTPIALTVPLLFIEGIQSQEDYYSRPFFSSLSRILRVLALHFTLFLPALYVAVVGYTPNVIPGVLLNTIAAHRSGIPFPSPVEAFVMLVTWEVLREGGVRIPKPAGQALSIVGALVIGEMGVSAGLVGPVLVIVIAATGLMGYLFIPQINSIAVLRFPILIMTSVFGVVGLFISYTFLVIHLVSLRSFGVPYMAPLMPFNWKDMKDTFIRVPWNLMKTRPRTIGWNNRIRSSGRGLQNNGK